jgi:hypothetical protein
VFKLKLDEFMEDLVKRAVLGRVLAYTSVIEFQKRGLPHCHALLILKKEDSPLETSDIDEVVFAEIPDPIRHAALHKGVLKYMMHGPCGVYGPRSPCMVEREDGMECMRNFPKEKRFGTSVAEDAFPKYRRRCLHNTMKGGKVSYLALLSQLSYACKEKKTRR